MPLTVHLSDSLGKAAYQEFNAAGGKVPPTGIVAFTSDNPAVATVDRATGAFTAYVGVGTANISASDGGSLPASDVLTVVADVPATATVTLTPGA